MLVAAVIVMFAVIAIVIVALIIAINYEMYAWEKRWGGRW